MDMKDFTALAGKQRVFRARQKVCLAGFVSHITQRAAGGEPLFLEDSDYLLMLSLLKDAEEKFDLSFYALCFMKKHVHLLLKPSKDNLSEGMHSIFFRYARSFNQRYERKGHKFGSSGLSVLPRKEKRISHARPTQAWRRPGETPWKGTRFQGKQSKAGGREGRRKKFNIHIHRAGGYE